MAGYVGRLEPGQTLQAGDHFKGPWRSFSRTTIEAGQEQTFNASDAEFSIFVMSGHGQSVIGSQAQPVSPGSALTVGYRAQLTLRADDSPVEVFVTIVDIPQT